MRRNAADNSLVDVERVLVVRAALSTLSASQLAVVFLHYWEDLTMEQTATQLGLGVGTARTHLARAKRRLRSVSLLIKENRHECARSRDPRSVGRGPAG